MNDIHLISKINKILHHAHDEHNSSQKFIIICYLLLLQKQNIRLVPISKEVIKV